MAAGNDDKKRQELLGFFDLTKPYKETTKYVPPPSVPTPRYSGSTMAPVVPSLLPTSILPTQRTGTIAAPTSSPSMPTALSPQTQAVLQLQKMATVSPVDMVKAPPSVDLPIEQRPINFQDITNALLQRVSEAREKVKEQPIHPLPQMVQPPSGPSGQGVDAKGIDWQEALNRAYRGAQLLSKGVGRGMTLGLAKFPGEFDVEPENLVEQVMYGAGSAAGRMPYYMAAGQLLGQPAAVAAERLTTPSKAVAEAVQKIPLVTKPGVADVAREAIRGAAHSGATFGGVETLRQLVIQAQEQGKKPVMESAEEVVKAAGLGMLVGGAAGGLSSVIRGNLPALQRQYLKATGYREPVPGSGIWLKDTGKTQSIVYERPNMSNTIVRQQMDQNIAQRGHWNKWPAGQEPKWAGGASSAGAADAAGKIAGLPQAPQPGTVPPVPAGMPSGVPSAPAVSGAMFGAVPGVTPEVVPEAVSEAVPMGDKTTPDLVKRDKDIDFTVPATDVPQIQVPVQPPIAQLAQPPQVQVPVTPTEPAATPAPPVKVKAELKTVSDKDSSWEIVTNWKEIDKTIDKAVESNKPDILPEIPVEYYFGKQITGLPTNPYPGISFRGAVKEEFDNFLQTGKTGNFWTGNPSTAFSGETPNRVVFAGKGFDKYDPIKSPEDNGVREKDDVYAVWRYAGEGEPGHLGVNGWKLIYKKPEFDMKQLNTTAQPLTTETIEASVAEGGVAPRTEPLPGSVEAQKPVEPVRTQAEVTQPEVTQSQTPQSQTSIKQWQDIKDLDAQIRTIEAPEKKGDEWVVKIGLQESLGEQGGDIITREYNEKPTMEQIRQDVISEYKRTKDYMNSQDYRILYGGKSGRDELVEGAIDKVLAGVEVSESLTPQTQPPITTESTATPAQTAPSPPTTEAAPMPDTFNIHRRDIEGADLTGRPHGLYVSWVKDPEKFTSPHEDVGDVEHWGTASPRNPLIAQEVIVEHARFGFGGRGDASAGVAALKELVPKEEFNRLLTLTKPELVELLNKEFPGPDYNRYEDAYELLETYSAQLARQKGHDAIVLEDTTMPEFSEVVVLDDRIVNWQDAPAPVSQVQTAAPTTEPTTPQPAATPTKPITTLPISVSKDDIPYDLAKRAYSAISFTPEKRAMQVQQDYVEDMQSLYEELSPLADTPEKQELLEAEMGRYRDGYLKRYKDVLSAKSRTMSPMITGPAKFPTSRNQKALDAEHKKMGEFIEWRDKAIKAIRRKLGGGPGGQVISSDDADAIEKLQTKLKDLEKLHEAMKSANKIVRKKNLSNEEKVAQLQKIDGISENAAKQLLEPDFAGRLGFASYKLTNNNAEIRRLKGRIKNLESKRADDVSEVSFDGGTIVDNVEANRVQIYFDEKPDEAIRKELKSKGFRWSPRAEYKDLSKAWQKHRSDNAIRQARKIAGVKDETTSTTTPRETWQIPKERYVTYKRGSAKELQEHEHRHAVEKALEEGKPVPEEVLRDYPELREPQSTIEQPQPTAETPPTPATPTEPTTPKFEEIYKDFTDWFEKKFPDYKNSYKLLKYQDGEPYITVHGIGEVFRYSEYREATTPSRQAINTARRLRSTAQNMQKKIDEKLDPAVSHQAPTARRARIAAGMEQEAESMQQTQASINAIADNMEAGTLPESLAGITSKAQVETLRLHREMPTATVNKSDIKDLFEWVKGRAGTKEPKETLDRALLREGKSDWGVELNEKEIEALETLIKKAKAIDAVKDKHSYSLNNMKDRVAEYKRMASAGIKSNDDFKKAKEDLAKITEPPPKEDSQERKIKELERELIGTKIPGYFPTPKLVVDKMLKEADIKAGMKVLEPSAGKGNIADAIKDAGVKPDVIEINPTLRELLKTKGHKLVADDFLEHKGEYDRIIMNPPFEKGQDIDHVRHAYELLKPDGKLVSIMSEGPFFRGDKKATEFREWLDEVGGTSEKLPQGSFKGKDSDRQTGVATRMVTIEKGDARSHVAATAEPPTKKKPSESIAATEPPKEHVEPTTKAQEARRNQILDKRLNYPDRGVLTRRQFILDVMDEGAKFEVVDVKDDAGTRKIEREIENLERGFISANPNHPTAIKYKDLKDKLKQGITKTEYRVTIPDEEGFYDITKTEYDYAIRIRDESKLPKLTEAKKEKLKPAPKTEEVKVTGKADVELDLVDNMYGEWGKRFKFGTKQEFDTAKDIIRLLERHEVEQKSKGIEPLIWLIENNRQKDLEYAAGKQLGEKVTFDRSITGKGRTLKKVKTEGHRPVPGLVVAKYEQGWSVFHESSGLKIPPDHVKPSNQKETALLAHRLANVDIDWTKPADEISTLGSKTKDVWIDHNEGKDVPMLQTPTGYHLALEHYKAQVKKGIFKHIEHPELRIPKSVHTLFNKRSLIFTGEYNGKQILSDSLFLDIDVTKQDISKAAKKVGMDEAQIKTVNVKGIVDNIDKSIKKYTYELKSEDAIVTDYKDKKISIWKLPNDKTVHVNSGYYNYFKGKGDRLFVDPEHPNNPIAARDKDDNLSGVVMPIPGSKNEATEYAELIKKLTKPPKKPVPSEFTPVQEKVIGETKTKQDSELAYEDVSAYERVPEGKRISEARKQLNPSISQIISKNAVAKKIEEHFGVRIRLGRFRGKSRLAIYKERPEVIRAKVKSATTIRVLTHELGHHLDKILNLSVKNYEKELLSIPYVKQLQTAKPKTPITQLRKEGVAEFVRMYLTDPAGLERLVPRFYNDFMDKMTLHPDIHDKLLDLQKTIAVYTEQLARAKVAAFIAEEPRKNQFSMNRLYDYVVDELAPISRMVTELTGRQEGALPAEKDPYKLFRVAKGYHGKADLFVKHGQYTFTKKGEAKKVGPSLTEIQQPIADLGEEVLDDFTYYMVAKRALEIEEKDKVSGLDKKDAQAFVKEIESGPHANLFRKQLQEVIKFNRFILRQLVGSSLSQEQYNKIVKDNAFYTAPFYRVRTDIASGRGTGGDKFANRGRGVQRLKGADLPISNPWQNIVRQTFALTGLADKMRAMQKLIELKDSFEGTGKFFDEVPTPMLPVNVNVMDVIERLADLGGIDTQMPEDDLQNMMLTMFKPQGMGNVYKNLLMVWFDGKPKFYDFADTDLMRAVMHMDSEQIVTLGKLGRFLANFMRVGHTMNPRFLFYNPARDQFAAGAYSKHGYIPWVDFFRGVFEIIGQGDMFKEWTLAGGAMSTYDTFDKNYLEGSLRKFTRKKWHELARDAVNPLTYLRKLASTSEYATNLGEYMRAKEKGAHWIDASLAGRDITVDHARHGSKTGPVRDFVAFFNATIQGHDKMYREFRKYPSRTLLRMVMFITLPTIALYLLNRKNENYHELPAWRKDATFNIPIGNPANTKTFLPVPKPFLPGLLFGSMIERFLAYADKKDKKAFDGWAEQFWNESAPNTTIWPLELAYEWGANYNFYTKNPIVPQREEKLPAGEQYGPYTSETAKLLGRLFNLSPRKIDHGVRKATGILGSTATQGTDALLRLAGVADPTPRPEATITDYPVIGDFFAQTRATGSYSIDRFYNDLNKAERIYASERGARNKEEAIYALLLPELRRIARELSNTRALERRIHKAITWGDIREYAPSGVSSDTKITPQEKSRALEYLDWAQINLVRGAYGKEPIPIVD